MGNRTSMSTGSGGATAKVPPRKMLDADTDTGELELDPHRRPSSKSSGRSSITKMASTHYSRGGRSRQDDSIMEIVRGPMDRDDGLGQLAVLPDECILHVLSFLGLADISTVASVSRWLLLLGRDDSLWRLLYQRSMRRLVLLLHQHGIVLPATAGFGSSGSGLGRSSTHLGERGGSSRGGNGGGGSGVGGRGSQVGKGAEGRDHQQGLLNNMNCTFNFSRDAKGRQRRKERRCGKWLNICRLNYVRLPPSAQLCGEAMGGESLIITEQLLGWPIDKVNELLDVYDEMTPVNRNGAYYYYPSSFLLICFEDDRVTSVLKNIQLESCTGPAYTKIIPR